ncbi:hypothetical protein [Sphingomonas sp. MS122]
MSLFDLVYDWLIHVVPTWLWWVLAAPLFAFVAILVVGYLWPDLLGL